MQANTIYGHVTLVQRGEGHGNPPFYNYKGHSSFPR